MKRLLAIPAALLAAGCLLAAAPLTPGPSPPRGEGDKTAAPDYQDFVFFGDARPVLIRFHIETDGRPLEAAWDDFIGRLFTHLDIDGDGILSPQEFLRAPQPAALFNNGPVIVQVGGIPARPARPAPDDDGPKWTMKRFAQYYRRVGGGPFQSQVGAAGGPIVFAPNGQAIVAGGLPFSGDSADAINDAFFKLLDTDGDGKISREELAAAPEVLMKLDADEDEVVTLDELLGRSAPVNPLVVRFAQPNAPRTMPAANARGLFLAELAGDDGAQLTRMLQQRYRNGSDALTRADLGLDQRTFDRLDADGDGKLDAEELARFADRPADVDLKVRLGKRSPKEAMIEVMKDDKDPSPPAAAVSTTPDGSVRIELGAARLDLRIADAGPTPAPYVREQILAEFKAADRDGNGYLDEQEAMQSRVFRNLFKAMDRDGDGKLFEKEVTAYLDAMEDLQSAAAAGVASATFADDGRGLFDLIDANHDGRLSVREMRQMVKLIDQLDRDGDGKISRSEIQKTYQLVFRQGPRAAAGLGGSVVFVATNGYGPRGGPPPEAARGPLWFRKMDRNHDGDVSRKEFLGTDEEFKRLDLDGDGLISVEEAEKAEQTLRRGDR